MNDYLLLLINGFAGKSHLLDIVMIFFAKYLVYLVFMTAVGCLAYWAYRRQWRTAGYFLATLVVSFVLLKLASLLNVDHRPFMDHTLTQLVTHAPGKSFPSDHTTVTTAIAAGLLFVTPFKKLGLAVLAAAVVIGFARIFVGIHYPADIVGGLATGLAGGALVLMAKRLIERQSNGMANEPITD
jgi:undecaprenyl-diphosphatase